MKGVFCFSLLFSLVVPRLLFAEVRFTAPIKIQSELRLWADGLKHVTEARKTRGHLSATGYTACATARELPGLILCASTALASINRAFMRATFWSEGDFGVPRGHLFSQNDPKFLQLLTAASGNDLVRSDLDGFLEAVKSACQKNKEYCLNEWEREVFGQIVIPFLKQPKNFAVITFALDDPEWLATVSHELHHGQYFLDARFRYVVDRFWAVDMTDYDRQTIAHNFSGVFDISNALLVKNEFQTMLINQDRRFLSERMISRLRPVLLDQFSARGVQVLNPY